jgi:hypothetical protein
MVGANHVTVVFRVKPAGKVGGVYQVAEHYGELAALGFRGGRFWGRVFRLSRWLVLGR